MLVPNPCPGQHRFGVIGRQPERTQEGSNGFVLVRQGKAVQIRHTAARHCQQRGSDPFGQILVKLGHGKHGSRGVKRCRQGMGITWRISPREHSKRAGQDPAVAFPVLEYTSAHKQGIHLPSLQGDKPGVGRYINA